MRKLNASTFLRFVFVLLSTYILKASSAPTTSNPKIVIIGAGPSGIAAGVKLLDYGFEDVTILEAEQRIGGRIHTIPFGDNVVDMGAQWCHGEKNNVVYEMMKDMNVFGSSTPLYENITLIRSNGEMLSNDDKNTLRAIMEEIESKRKNKSIPIHISAHDFMKEELDSVLKRPEYQYIDKEIAAEILVSRENEECSAESSDNLEVISAVGDKEYEMCEGDQTLTWKDKGYKTVLNFLMKSNDEIGKEYGVLQNHIRLSKKVKSINWKRNDNKVLINCEDGEEILADHVIVTVSLGVLKANHVTLFEPALPNKKQAAIKEIEFGSVGKIFLEFDKKHWPDYWTGFVALWTQEDLDGIDGIRRSEDLWWWEGIAGFFAVDYQPRLLEVWLVGPSARFMETLSDDVIKDSCVKILERFLKRNISEPVNITRTDWFTNPNFRGTYSYHSIKTLESLVSPSDLEETLNVPLMDCVKENEDVEYNCEKPIVQFAGEATNVRHFSTVHGAIESGWREAKRLADFYGIAKDN